MPDWAVANTDLTLHQRGETVGITFDGQPVEMSESFNVIAGDPFDVEALASYQRKELEDPNSRLSSMVTRVSAMEAQARAEASGTAEHVIVSGGGPGEVTITQQVAPPPAPPAEGQTVQVDVKETGTEVSVSNRDHLRSPAFEAMHPQG